MQLAGGMAAAQQGMFAVDTAAGSEMVRSVRQIRERLNERLSQINLLKTEAMLGDLPEARTIAELNVQVASGDEQSLDYVLRRFAETLEEAEHALKIGMRNYEQIEAQAEQGFRRIGEG
ncbi:MAG: hypothetical protein ACT4NY_17960 [Pseudonocardiales bacterium]